jgi:hypothetical protein
MKPWRLPPFRWRQRSSSIGWVIGLGAGLGVCLTALATPANRAGLNQHYDRFLTRKLNQCSTCHQAKPGGAENPTSLEEFPHNPFGDQLRRAASVRPSGTGSVAETDSPSPGGQRPPDIGERLRAIAALDADGDGVANEAELLLGHHPGNAQDVPGPAMLETLPERQAEFARFARAYRWQPFASVRAPQIPSARNPRWVRNPIDAFVAAVRDEKGLRPRPDARREVLLRRIYMDLIGLAPTPEEQRAFLADTSADAYERVVDRLLNDPRHGERWGRHWMDIWRYSDWAGWADGNQIRDSKPHIWRWRDWIVESLNDDKGYDRMMMEMLAADEFAPLDTNALRATGYLVRNYKMLSREQWMEDTIKHTGQAFLGVTLGCAKCHDHMTDPISQADYYRVRAIFEPHHVRTDRLPGELDTAKMGLVRAFDTGSNRVTHFLMRGDERHPDTNRLMQPGVPAALCGQTALAALQGQLPTAPIRLPGAAAQPDHREFVRRDLVLAGERALRDAERELAKLDTNASAAVTSDRVQGARLTAAVARAKQASLRAVLHVEAIEETGGKPSHEWTLAAMEATASQRALALAEAQLKHHQAAGKLAQALQLAKETASATNALATPGVKSAPIPTSGAPVKKKAREVNPDDRKDPASLRAAAEKAGRELQAAQKQADETLAALNQAERSSTAPITTAYQRRPVDQYPMESSGRRLAFAQWLADTNNPLTARVAVNHVWLRHFGRGLVPTTTDFGRGGRAPSHPALLDWLAVEFMRNGWSLKALHRLMVTSSTYRMASTPDETCAQIDPDNTFLWRMPSRRLEAEAVRDNLLYIAGDLDLTRGGPEIDHQLGLTSKRRSLYLRLAAEKEVEFLRIFDGPTVTECYERRPSVIPQQALALGNSEIAFRQAASLAARLTRELPTPQDDEAFIQRAYASILARSAQSDELVLCREFLQPAVRAALAPRRHLPLDSSRKRQRENLILVLLNHNDFVTVR